MPYLKSCAPLLSLILLFRASASAGPAVAPGDACADSSLGSARIHGPFASQGHAYVVSLPRPGMSGDTSQEPRSSRVLVCEGDRMLGPAHAVHDQIRTVGKGHFSH